MDSDDDDGLPLQALASSKAAKTSQPRSASAKHDSSKIVKKQVKKIVAKPSAAPSKGTKAVAKTAVAKKKKGEDTDKKEKKKYDLPGQTKDTPEERDASRLFYESLHRQRPDSEMALFWMMEHGLLPEAEAKKALEKKLKSRQSAKGGPVKEYNGGYNTSVSRPKAVKEKPKEKDIKPSKKEVVKKPLPKKSTPGSNSGSKAPKKKPEKFDSDEDDDDDDDDEDFKAPKKARSKK